MGKGLLVFLKLLLQTGRDLVPVVLVILLFQLLVVAAPVPDLGPILLGAAAVLVGLTLLLRGLAMSLLPLGQNLTEGLVGRGGAALLLLFAFLVGFASTAAEPALGAVARKAALAAQAGGLLAEGSGDAARYADLLRYSVAAAVGLGVVLGVLRIIKGWPAVWLVLPAYGLAVAAAPLFGGELAAVAFDAGAAATSAINVPLIAALGVGLASVLRGRDPLVDGFGIVALCSAMPIFAVFAVSAVFAA